jgi:hypothetical protein
LNKPKNQGKPQSLRDKLKRELKSKPKSRRSSRKIQDSMMMNSERKTLLKVTNLCLLNHGLVK